jgi:predicted TIM-barrel fold metal-dependent hydrolase
MTGTDAAVPPLCLPPRSPAPISPSPLPSGAVDCHFHVIRQGAPLSATRNYTPQVAPLGDWLAYAGAVGIERGVVVQPSVYGRDNTVVLAALAAEPKRLRGIVVIDPDLPDAELRSLDRAGVRGVRFNMRNPGGLGFSDLRHLAGRIAPLGWHLQLLLDGRALEGVAAAVADSPVPVVIDHIGLVPVADQTAGPRATAALARLVASGRCYVKLSAPYRLAPHASSASVAAVVAALVRANPERLLWGSDWPHTELFETMVDDVDLIAESTAWFDDPGLRERVFVTNPAKLYWA